MANTKFSLARFSVYERFLVMAISIFCIVFFAFGFWKYTHFRYDALDLGIYTQVFFNTLHGNWFGMTIHPHSYLGDHVELVLLFFVPLYALFQNALTLVFLQVIWMAFAAVPLFCIVKNVLNERLAFFTALFYLGSAFTHNITIFEWHALSFAVPVLFCFFLVYERKRYFWFLVCMILLLATREDVGLVVGFFALVPFIERRHWRWWIIPLVTSAIWFVVALRVGAHFSGYDHYKFAVYYGWLGTEPFTIVRNLFNPFIALPKIFTFDKVFFLLAIMVSFAALPLLRLKYMLPTLPIFAQFLLTGGSAGEAILKSHYMSLLLPWLFIASVYGLARVHEGKNSIRDAWPLQRMFMKWIQYEPKVSQLLVVVIVLYTFFTLSPLPAFAWQGVRRNAGEDIKRSIYQVFLQVIQPYDAVVATYRFLPQLANRKFFYSAHYIFKGTKQLSLEPYPVPQNVDVFLYDSSVTREFELQWLVNGKKDIFFSGDDRMRDFLQMNHLGLSMVLDDVLLFRRDAQEHSLVVPSETVPKFSSPDETSHAGVTFLGYTPLTSSASAAHGISFVFRRDGSVHDSYFLHIRLRDSKNSIVYEKSYALGYGIWPLESWDVGVPMEARYWFVFPSFAGEIPTASVQLETIRSGVFDFDGVRSVRPTKEKSVPLSQEIFFSL